MGDQRDCEFLLLVCQRSPGANAVPFLQAPPAAGGGGMLSDEHGMATHRRLTAIVPGAGRRQTSGDEISRVIEHSLATRALQVAAVAIVESQTPSERRAGQTPESGVKVVADLVLRGHQRSAA